MRSILEKAFVALLNEEHDKAEELFHKFMVERARQIHESIRSGEEFVLEENWDDEITTESYFTEEDLTDLEDGAEGDDADADADADFGGDIDADGDADAGADLDADADADADADFGADADADADLGGEAVEGDVEDKIDNLADQIEKLTAEFEAMMDAIGGDDGDADADADFGADADADADADFGGDEFDAEGDVDADDADAAGDLEDDMGDAAEGEAEDEPKPFGESEEVDEEDFDDITESIIDELEKVQVSLTDGKEIADGKSFTQNKTSPAPQKSKDARMGGEPVKIKSSKHSGFARETAPGVETMKPRRNNVSKANAALSKVSKEGDKSAEINKLGSEENTTSLIPGGKPGFKK